MSERMRESLSAMMDDEAQELELERVMAITKSPITKWSPPPAFLF